MASKGLAAAAAPVQHVAAFTVLQAYGTARLFVERGQLPTSDEFAQMALETLVLMVGIGIATRGMGRYLAAREDAAKFRNLRVFERSYGHDFADLEIERGELVNDFRQALAKGRAEDAATQANLEARGRDLGQRMSALIERVESQGKVDLAGLRAEIEGSGFPQLEVGQELLARTLGLPVEVALRFEGVDGQYSYRFGGTGRIESRLRDIGARVEKSADLKTGLRAIEATFPGQRPIAFLERSDPFPGQEQHRVDDAHPGFQQLLTDFSIPKGRLGSFVAWMVQREMAGTGGEMKGAVKIVREYLARLHRSAKVQGKSLASLLTEVSHRGVLAAEHPVEAAIADQLDAHGIRDSRAWQDARTPQEFVGAVSEWLAFTEASGRAPAGQRVLRSVHLRGDMFRDAALTQQHRTDTDVVPEIDLLRVSEDAGRFLVHAVSNVKGYGAGGAADAARQNTQALAVLRSHMLGRAQRVMSRTGTAYWVRVSEVTAFDPATGTTVDLTGRLSEAPGGGLAETVGPRGAQGYGESLSVDAKQIERVSRILREWSAGAERGF
jgi:hypothetical protein